MRSNGVFFLEMRSKGVRRGESDEFTRKFYNHHQMSSIEHEIWKAPFTSSQIEDHWGFVVHHTPDEIFTSFLKF
jgi:hypothetical protein